MDKTGVTVCWVCETLSACVLPAGRWGWRRRWWWEARSPCGRTDRSCRPCRPERSARTDTETRLWSVSTNSCRDRQEKTISFIWSNVDILLQHIQPGFFFLFSKTLPALWGHNKQIYSPVLTFKYVAVKSKHSTQQKSFFEDKNCKGNKSYIKTRCTENESYLSLDAPRARTMGSAISSMDCRMEATTMKRMMERRKALWMTWSSMRPVWTARISRVMPSVIPLHRNEHARWLKLTTRHQQTPSTNPHTHILADWPVHCVVIHKGSVTLKVELAECENSQSNEGDGENQTQQGVRCTTTFCNTEDRKGGRRRRKEVES